MRSADPQLVYRYARLRLRTFLTGCVVMFALGAVAVWKGKVDAEIPGFALGGIWLIFAGAQYRRMRARQASLLRHS